MYFVYFLKNGKDCLKSENVSWLQLNLVRTFYYAVNMGGNELKMLFLYVKEMRNYASSTNIGRILQRRQFSYL